MRLRSISCIPLVVAAIATCAAAVAPARAAVPVHQCRSVTAALSNGGEGAAVFIRARGVSCDRARRVAKACVRGTHSGWQATTEARIRDGLDVVRFILRRGRALSVSFEIAGGGGCAPLPSDQ